MRAGDLQVDAEVEILNPDLHIATLNRDGDLRMEVEIDGGRGYVSADQHSQTDRPIGVIPIDSLFSPVTKVNYNVETTRLGQRIDYDKLTLEVWTDRSILPSGRGGGRGEDPARPLQPVHPLRGADRGGGRGGGRRGACMRVRKLLDKSVEELELSVRSSNCLRAAEIKTIGDLVQKSEPEMLKYRNFGRKSLKEIQDILGEMGLSLRDGRQPLLREPDAGAAARSLSGRRRRRLRRNG